jgi:hypothetical protein
MTAVGHKRAKRVRPDARVCPLCLQKATYAPQRRSSKFFLAHPKSAKHSILRLSGVSRFKCASVTCSLVPDFTYSQPCTHTANGSATIQAFVPTEDGCLPRYRVAAWGRCAYPTQEAVDCGTYTCNAGMKCGSRNQCMAWDAVDCGGGKSCPVGHVCLKAGAECLTPQQIAERDAAERARKQAEAERIKREAEERKAAKQRRLEEQREAAKERQRLLAEKRTQGEEVRQAAIAEEKKQRAAKAEAQRAAAAEGKLQNSNQPSSAITAPNSMASPVESSSKPLAHSATVEKSVTIGTAFEVGRGAPIPYVVAHPLYGSPASAKQPAPTSSAGSSLTSSAIPTNSGHTASRRAASDPTGTTWASYGRAANGSVIDTRTGEVIVSGTGPRVSRSPTEFQAIGTTRFPPSAGPTPNQSASVQRPHLTTAVNPRIATFYSQSQSPNLTAPVLPAQSRTLWLSIETVAKKNQAMLESPPGQILTGTLAAAGGSFAKKLTPVGDLREFLEAADHIRRKQYMELAEQVANKITEESAGALGGALMPEILYWGEHTEKPPRHM